MENEKRFKLKKGFCHIFPDKIVITRDGIIRKTMKINLEYNRSWIILLYAMIILLFSWCIYANWQNGKMLQAALFAFFGIFLIFRIQYSFGFSQTGSIDRYRIKKVVFKKGFAGLIRPGFVVFFEDDMGKLKKRILLPYIDPSDIQGETEKALKIMMNENLLN